MPNDTTDHIDERTFQEAYELHWHELLVIAKRHLPDEEVAKGLVQNVYISLWERRHTIVIHTSLRNYLSRALKLKVLEYYRSRQVRERYKEHAIMMADTHASHADQHLSYKELFAAMNSAIDQLPERCRQVYLMSRNEGLPNKLIAAELLITEKAVENNMTRALAYLRNRLKLYR